MPAPSKTEYARKSDVDDNMVCAYKGLRTTVLVKLQAHTDSLPEGETKKSLLVFIEGLDVAPKVGALRHAKACSAKSSCGFKQRRRPGKIEKSEELLVANVGKAAAGADLAGEQASVLAVFANNEEAQCAVDGQPEVAA